MNFSREIAMFELVAPLANQPTVVALILSATVCVILFQLRKCWLGKGITIPDMRLHWYTPSDVKCFLDRLGTDKKRHLYAFSEVTVDVVFPITYGLLAMISLHCLIGDTLPNLAWLMYLPLVTAGADLLENVTVAWLAVTHQKDALPRKLAWVTATGTFIKWRSAGLLLLTLAGLVVCTFFV